MESTIERPGVSDYPFPDESRFPEPELPEAQLPEAELAEAQRLQAAIPPTAQQRLVRDDSIDPANPYEGATPPGYDWPTHGGYLGCLLGVMTSCLIGGFVGSTLFPALAHYNFMPGWVAGLLTLVVFVLLIAGIGRLGYVLGRRFLREYPQPTGKTWGEDDDYIAAEHAAAPGVSEKTGASGVSADAASPAHDTYSGETERSY